MSYKTKKITVVRDAVYQYVCDHCGDTHNIQEVDQYYRLPKSWHEFSSGHSDWGNDSIESHEQHHACSAKCYVEILKKQIKENKRYGSFKIDDLNHEFAKGLTQLKFD